MADLGFCEITVSSPEGKKYGRGKRIKYSVICGIVSLIFGVAVLFSRMNTLLIPLYIVYISVTSVLMAFLIRRTKLQYDYSIYDGVFTVAAIYDRKSRRTLNETELKKVELIAPDDGTYSDRIKEYKPEAELDVTFEGGENRYFMLYEDDGKRTVLYFAGELEFVRVMRRYNARTVVKFNK